MNTNNAEKIAADIRTAELIQIINELTLEERKELLRMYRAYVYSRKQEIS